MHVIYSTHEKQPKHCDILKNLTSMSSTITYVSENLDNAFNCSELDILLI